MITSTLRRAVGGERSTRGRGDDVVVVGAGFGGLAAAEAIADLGDRVHLLDRRNHHLFQPLLYQVATAGLEPSDIAYTARGIAKRQDGVRFSSAEVVGADLRAKVLTTAGGRRIPYGTLVLAAGARTASFGVPGVETHAHGLKSLDDALAIRRDLLERFERCAAEPGLVGEGLLDVVVVGGGPTGVEMAGAIAELYDKVLGGDYPELDLSQVRVTLVEMVDTVLAPFHPRLQRHAVRQLERRGVTVRLGESVAEVRDGEVELGSGQVIGAGVTVWAAGVQAEPLGELLGLATSKAGRIVVDAHLNPPEEPDVFVIGDLAASTDSDGDLLPQLAPVAMQQGRHVAEVLRARRDGEDPPTFRYRDKGSMATIGRRAAVAELPGGIAFGGALAWLAWLALHLYFLIGFRNRFSVLLNWAWNYLTWDRAARVVTEPVAHRMPVDPDAAEEDVGGSSGTPRPS